MVFLITETPLLACHVLLQNKDAVSERNAHKHTSANVLT